MRKDVNKEDDLIKTIAIQETDSNAQALVFERSMRKNQGMLNTHDDADHWKRKLIRRKILGRFGLSSSVSKGD